MIQEAIKMLRSAWSKIRPVGLLKFLLLSSVLGLLGFILDPLFWKIAPVAPGSRLEALAEALSYWGDFIPGTLPLVLALALGGAVFSKVAWRKAALATLLAAVLAGVFVNLPRLISGRPRPCATLTSAMERLGRTPSPRVDFGRTLRDGQLKDGFYGFERPAMFQAFPSGHSATSMATATALVFTLPPLAWVVVPLALGVCWSRLALDRHSVSDVLVGGLIGLVFGRLLGRASRETSRR